MSDNRDLPHIDNNNIFLKENNIKLDEKEKQNILSSTLSVEMKMVEEYIQKLSEENEET